MKLKFTNGKKEPETINIKGKCTISGSDNESDKNENLTVKVDGKKVSVMLGAEEQETPDTIKLDDIKYSIFTTIAGLDGDSENLTQKDIALAKEQYKNGGEIWDSLKNNGVTEIRYDSRAGVATIVIGDKDFLRIDFETGIEKIKNFFRIGTKMENKIEENAETTETTTATVIENKKEDYQSFNQFLTDLASQESSSNPNAINELGYAGLYQLGEAAFASLGIYKKPIKPGQDKPNYNNDWSGKFLPNAYGITSLNDFLKNKKIQKQVMIDYTKYNWEQIKRFKLDEIYLGKEINGQKITESGLLAGAHLGGPGSLKKYLESGGNTNRKDKYNSSIAKYVKQYAFYDMKVITGKDPVTKPKTRPPKTVEEEVTYIVKSGDSLSKIASAHNITVKEIIAANNLNSNKLQIGQKLTLFVPKDY